MVTALSDINAQIAHYPNSHLVGRTPWSARDAPSRCRNNDSAILQSASRPTGASAMDLGVRPTKQANPGYPRRDTMVTRMLPVDLKRELFEKLSAEIAKQIGRNGGTEEEVLADFESWRKSRRRAPADANCR